MKTVRILTHSGAFHADDIFGTALLRKYFAHKEPKTKVTCKRSIKPEDIEAADIVYDIGRIYNPKKLRFDHHQNDSKLVRKNGIPYAAFGLLFKHFGPELISLISKNTNKAFIKNVFETVEEKLVMHIDAMDNGVLTYKSLFDDVTPLTLDGYFATCKSTIDLTDSKQTDKTFFGLATFSESVVENIVKYAIKRETEKIFAVKIYKKAKDKRVMVCDRYYSFNFNTFPEPLVIIYPDARGNWSAKIVEKEGELYQGRFYFPESWAGLVDAGLEKVTGVAGSKFCHKARFLAVNKTKEGVLKMVEEAFKILKIK